MSDVRNIVKAVQQRLPAALAALEQELGVKFKIGRATYDHDGSFSVKLEGGIVGADGAVASREAADFKAMAAFYGLAPEHLGAKFKVDGKEHTITGLKARSSKRPILTSCGGKTYVWPESTVKLFLRASGVAVAEPPKAKVVPVSEILTPK